MLIDFTVENYRSFRDMVTLSMEAAPIESGFPELDTENTISVDARTKLLRSLAIYGANASGKSNLFKAFASFKRMVRLSSSGKEVLVHAVDDFVLNGAPESQPTFYQIRFISEGVHYRYGFEVEATGIVSEWLFADVAGQEVKYYTREGSTVSVDDAQIPEAKQYEHHFIEDDRDLFRSYSLFLTALATIGVPQARVVRDAIQAMGVVDGTETRQLVTNAFQWWAMDGNRSRGVAFLNAADTGIHDVGWTEEEMELEQMPESLRGLFQTADGRSQKIPRLTTLRRVPRTDGSEFALETLFEHFESQGTKKLVYILPLVLDALQKGDALWIDELDAGLHPLLTRKILDLFHGQDTNPRGAQLIFSTHDTNLQQPTALRRDQILLVEKDTAGASNFTTLAQIEGIRDDASYERDYLQGKYRAVPYLNRLRGAVQNYTAENG